MALTRRKKIAFALVAMTLSFIGVGILLLAADLVLHQRAERSAGLNRYGYRGPVIGRKKAGELRFVMLGGSTVFGYGVGWSESIPAQLGPRLTEKLGRPVSVVNLGFNNEGAYAFVPNLEDFAALDYDGIILYEGYNDLPGDEGVNSAVYRRDSAVYRLTGYYPILPLYLDEKAKMLRYGNDLNAAYDAARGNGKTVFHPNLAQRTSAGAMDAMKQMTDALSNQLARVADAPKQAALIKESQLGCTFPYMNYCESIARAVRFGLSRGDVVVVASQPRLPVDRPKELHTLQQTMLGEMVRKNFASERRVVWADMSQTVDLKDPQVTFDAMHLTPEANAKVAGALVEPVMTAIAALPPK